MILYTDIEPFCCNVLRARVADGGLLPGDVWERDVRTLTADELKPYTQVHLFCGVGGFPLGVQMAGASHVPMVTAGFPCVDISRMGRRAGVSGERSGLYRAAIDAIRMAPSSYGILENVAAITERGMGTVLADLAAIGRDAEWDCLSPCMFGVRQRRDRCFFVAHPHRRERAESRQRTLMRRQVTPAPFGDGQPVPHGVRVAQRPSDRVDIGKRIGACANIAAPQVVELVARAILSYEMTASERSGG